MNVNARMLVILTSRRDGAGSGVARWTGTTRSVSPSILVTRTESPGSTGTSDSAFQISPRRKSVLSAQGASDDADLADKPSRPVVVLDHRARTPARR